MVSIFSNGRFYSVKELIDYFGMNLIEIDTYIQMLRNWGVDIFSVPGKGYRLLQPIHLLDKEFICHRIKTGKVKIFPVIDSTNQYLMEHINEMNSGDICLAEYQQVGRGRRGREWFSSFGASLCFSIYWRFKKRLSTVAGLSLVIGITIAKILQKLTNQQIRVKWPNDLYFRDRKLAGVLVELVGKTNNSVQLIIGVGINLTMRRLQSRVTHQDWINLQDIGSIIDRNILIVKLIKGLHASLTRFEKDGLSTFLSSWEQLDNFINRPLKLIIGDRVIYGVSRGVNAQGALLLDQNGIVKPWFGDEISVRQLE